jgi:DNA-binding HxlR family transcriptional regulator
VTQKVLTETLREMEREDTGADKIIEFKETGHYVLPLTLTSMFEQYDPLS